MNLLPLPNHARRIAATLAAQTAERTALMARLQAAADSGDEDDATARQLEELGRDIARTRLKLDAAEAAQQRASEVERVKMLAKTRKAAEKLLAAYQADAEEAERLMREAAEAIGRMRASFAAFEAATPNREAVAYAATIKPHAIVERLQEVMRERLARQLKREGDMQASSARIERMSVADAFGSKRAGLLPWLTN